MIEGEEEEENQHLKRAMQLDFVTFDEPCLVENLSM